MEPAILVWIGLMVSFVVIVGLAFKKGYKEGYKEGVEDARRDFERRLSRIIGLGSCNSSDDDVFGVQSKVNKPELPKT